MNRGFNNKFIKDVPNDMYALVVDNEIILHTKIGSTGRAHHCFLRKVSEKSIALYGSYHEVAMDKNERINPVQRLTNNAEIKFRAEKVSKDLILLLETWLLTMVLTSTDIYHEFAMQKVYVNEL